jgi:hypothetical protein
MKKPKFMYSRAVLPIVALGVFALTQAAFAANPGVEPQIVQQAVRAGDCVTITKVVHTPVLPPKPDIVFLADNTGSMGPAIANVQDNAEAILAAIEAAEPEAQFAVASYTDFECPTNPYPYRLFQAITANNADVIAAINNWTAVGGCDAPEAQLNALYQLATTGAGYRSGSSKIIVWFGDANGHDPSNGHSLSSVINALVARDIRVIAIPVVSGFGNGLDTPVNGHQQASEIVAATGGVLMSNATPAQVADAILEGLGQVPVRVSAYLNTNCNPNLWFIINPTNQTVTSGTDAVFTEMICVLSNAPQCGTLDCVVGWTLNGNWVLLPDGSLDPAYLESVTILADSTPPTITCPANITVCSDTGACSAVVRFVPVASDNCGVVSIVSTPPSGSTFQKGTTIVTSTATDMAGNTASCTFAVTIIDCEPPTITCPPNITVCNDTGVCSAVVRFVPVATDNCGVASIVSTPPSGSVFPKGTTTVTCTATDPSGNQASCTFTVTVNDCAPPAVECVPTVNPAGTTVPAAGTNPKSGQNPDGFYQLVASDNCDGTNVAIYVKDSAEGPCGGAFSAGPYAPGTRVKLTQSPGRAGVKPMAGVIVAHIQTVGEPVLVVTDSSGNTTCHKCFVPPPPK